VRFWDTSAIVPLVLAEPESRRVKDLHRSDPVLLVWWGTAAECVSAIARPERAGESIGDAFERLDTLARTWVEVEASAAVRRAATRMLRTHPLTAAGALQLAAATVAAEDSTSSLPFVTFDRRLAEAADKEGFRVLGR